MYRKYEGPFNPPPATCMENAIAWRHISEPDPNKPNRWCPAGWMVITTYGILYVGLDGMAYRDSILWAP